jgi:hypothetical protein
VRFRFILPASSHISIKEGISLKYPDEITNNLSKENNAFLEQISTLPASPNISQLISMNYFEMVDYLLKKYGKAQNDYIVQSKKSGKYRKNVKIARTKEGLQCHHIDEYVIPALSLSARVSQSFSEDELEHHKADKLVYADVIEHLLLHIKIYQESKYNNVPYAVGAGGVYLLTENCINVYYEQNPNSNWHKNMYDKIKNNFDDYIIFLMFWLYVSDIKALEPYFHKVGEKKTVRCDICEKMAVCYGGTISKTVLTALQSALRQSRLQELITQKNQKVNEYIDSLLSTIRQNEHF